MFFGTMITYKESFSSIQTLYDLISPGAMLRGTVSALLLAVGCLVLAVTGGYVGRPQTIFGETPLAGIVRPMPLGGPPPSYNTQCCPCMSANQIYPGGYHVINRNLISPPILNQNMFQGKITYIYKGRDSVTNETSPRYNFKIWYFLSKITWYLLLYLYVSYLAMYINFKLIVYKQI